jgi:ABC-type multidrug transport system ATPase subunit
MGFVPQSDIMYRTLTVEENLTYSARFRYVRGEQTPTNNPASASCFVEETSSGV